MSSGNNFFEDLLSGGLFGVEDGKLTAGFLGKPLLEGTKEITGANAAEEANNIARNQFEEQQDLAIKARSDAQLQDKNNQIAASQGATQARRATPSSTGGKGSQVTGDVSDFLGL